MEIEFLFPSTDTIRSPPTVVRKLLRQNIIAKPYIIPLYCFSYLTTNYCCYVRIKPNLYNETLKHYHLFKTNLNKFFTNNKFVTVTSLITIGTVLFLYKTRSFYQFFLPFLPTVAIKFEVFTWCF